MRALSSCSRGDSNRGRIAIHPLLASLVVAAGSALMLSSPATAHAQASASYIVVTQSAPYVALPLAGGTTTRVAGSANVTGDQGFTIQLPFPFSFFGVSYSSLAATTNGYITFKPGNRLDQFSSWALPSTNDPTDILAVWWNLGDCRFIADCIVTQTIGTAPNRQFIIEFNASRWTYSAQWHAQVWLSEGSGTINVHYGSYASPSDYGTGTVTVGIQNQTGNEYHLGLPCNKCDGAAWPTNTIISYSQSPELKVDQVRVPPAGFAGVPMQMEATVTSFGAKDAEGFTHRFWINDAPSLGDSAIVLGTNAGTVDLPTGDSMVFTMNPRLPIHLTEGTYYIISEVDPNHDVPVSSRASTVLASPPFIIGLAAPNLTPTDIVAPERVKPGSDFTLSWNAANIGSADARAVPYRVVLSTHDLPNTSNPTLYEGLLDVAALQTTPVIDTIRMPADLQAGRYFLGVLIDPDQVLFEHERENNNGISNPVQVADDETLAITTTYFPDAELGSVYSVVLTASGGDGIHGWSVEPGSRLPPGLSLIETPSETRAEGRSFYTHLGGSPSEVGNFDFSLLVESAGLVERAEFSLEILPSGLPVAVSTREIPPASFNVGYLGQLVAIGGLPPYHWTVVEGALPHGLHLDPEGIIAGTPLKDGTIPVRVRVSDTVGDSAEAELEVVVMPPNSLVCASQSFPTHTIDDPYDEVFLLAAGGRVTWVTRQTQYLSGGLGQGSEIRAGEAPPGLVLRADGRVTGAPTRAGIYLWSLDVHESLDRDATRQPLKSIVCEVRVEVLVDHGLSVSTQALPAATVGESYLTQLQAIGGNGAIEWALMPGSKLPQGLSLDPDGNIAGSPADAELDGELSRVFSFMVRAVDPHNRANTASLSILVQQPHEFHVPNEKRDSTGCQAAGADPALLAFAIGLGLAALRRRRA